ncbi:hypothetical protein [White spot syndrome virus]|uniref:Uncharacterized protein n=1 Tax=White spot syndrome virus TaxID=342409 RepID=A0A0S2E5U1_9VIRU|nr:hypothetical protein [White spot syndrome virus]
MGVRAGSWKTPPPFHALPHYCTIFWCIKRHGEVAKTSTRRDITVKMTSPTSALRVATTALLFAVVVTATVISEAGGTKIDDRCAFPPCDYFPEPECRGRRCVRAARRGNNNNNNGTRDGAKVFGEIANGLIGRKRREAVSLTPVHEDMPDFFPYPHPEHPIGGRLPREAAPPLKGALGRKRREAAPPLKGALGRKRREAESLEEELVSAEEEREKREAAPPLKGALGREKREAAPPLKGALGREKREAAPPLKGALGRKRREAAPPLKGALGRKRREAAPPLKGALGREKREAAPPLKGALGRKRREAAPPLKGALGRKRREAAPPLKGALGRKRREAESLEEELVSAEEEREKREAAPPLKGALGRKRREAAPPLKGALGRKRREAAPPLKGALGRKRREAAAAAMPPPEDDLDFFYAPVALPLHGVWKAPEPTG